MMTKYASRLYKVPIDQVTPAMRAYAKQRAYMQMYGIQDHRLNAHGAINLHAHEYREVEPQQRRLNDANGVETT